MKSTRRNFQPQRIFSLIVTFPSPGIPPFAIYFFGIKVHTFQNCVPPNSIFCEILINIPSENKNSSLIKCVVFIHFRKRVRGRERGKKTNHWLPFTCSFLGIKPTIQAHTRTSHWTVTFWFINWCLNTSQAWFSKQISLGKCYIIYLPMELYKCILKALFWGELAWNSG